MTVFPQSYDGIALVAPVTIGYERTSDHGAAYFAGRALRALLDRTGLKKDEIDGLALSSFTMKPDTAVAATAHFGLSPRWLEDIPMGGASGVVAMRRAARAVQMGDADIVACISADTNNKDSFSSLVADFSLFSRDAVHPYGAAGPNAVFSMITQNYMREFGAAREDFGRLAVAQRRNARDNPHALFHDPLTLETYMNARPIAGPIHLFDCVMPCAGADAFLVMSVDRAKSLGLPYVVIKGAVERHNAYADDPVPTRGGWAMERERLYGMAGLGPKDVDFVETYDDYPVISFLQIEDLGLCAKGEAGRFFRDTDTTIDGQMPHNTSGGQLSAGQAGAAGGYLGLVEAIRQLTGDKAPSAQIAKARHGLVSGYGMVIYDRCLCTAAALLARGDA
ncbi:thiolase family protein [Govanella unica]|uniref:Thiolase family protein n=1 Tax=Govanella unica TaxID=2975056 RepID=A0A9X3Z6Y3_9PROT|nr:thiolase family protein [Govania unica]MDA5193503.1 thiolase family protein [Govania unica]